MRRWALAAWEILRALGPMVVIEISLRSSDLPTTCRRLGVGCDLDSPAPPATGLAVLPQRARPAVLGSLTVVSRWPAGDTCLRRCLLIGHRLRRLEPVLRIGVKRNANGELSVHSWLEFGGSTLDPAAFEFAPLTSSGR
ncbi:MAG: lasso peptide biosynthesis B2 protein [Actinomycetes bacterium]